MRKENKHRIVVYVSDDIYSLLEKEDEPNRSKFIEDILRKYYRQRIGGESPYEFNEMELMNQVGSM